MCLTGGHTLWQLIKILSLFSSAALKSTLRVRTSFFFFFWWWPSSRDVPRAAVRHPVLFSEWWEHTLIFCKAASANILSVGLFALYEPESGAAEAQKDASELDFSRVLSLWRGGKSHSCEFFQLQVSLAENSRQQRTSKALFHTLFQLNSSLYGVGFGTAFVRLWVTQKMKTSQSFKRCFWRGEPFQCTISSHGLHSQFKTNMM